MQTREKLDDDHDKFGAFYEVLLWWSLAEGSEGRLVTFRVKENKIECESNGFPIADFWESDGRMTGQFDWLGVKETYDLSNPEDERRLQQRFEAAVRQVW